MLPSDSFSRAAGTFTLRQLAGWIFLMQGFGKLANFGMDQVINNFFLGNEVLADKLPDTLLIATAYFTTYGELIGGLLLVLGLFSRYAGMLLAAVLIVVTIGHGLESPIWNLEHVIFRAVVLIPLLLLPGNWDRWSIDRLLFRRNT